MKHLSNIRPGTTPLAALVTLLAIFVAAPALAQDKKAEKKAQEEQFQGPLKDQLREYWSVERDVGSVLNRLYTRKEKIHLGLQLGTMPSEPFYTYYPVGIHGGYFLSDSFGIEGMASFYIPTGTDLTSYLESERGDSFDIDKHTEDRYIARVNVVATWHPLYGKWALLQRKLSHLDFNLLAGAGVVIANRPNEKRESSNVTPLPEIVFGAGLNFFVHKDVSMRLQWRSYITPGPTFDTSDELAERGFFSRLNVPSEFLLGATYAF